MPFAIRPVVNYPFCLHGGLDGGGFGDGMGWDGRGEERLTTASSITSTVSIKAPTITLATKPIFAGGGRWIDGVGDGRMDLENGRVVRK